MLTSGLCRQHKQSLYFEIVAHRPPEPSSLVEELWLNLPFHPCNMHLSSRGCHAPSIPVQPCKGFWDAKAEASSDCLEGMVGKGHTMGGRFLESGCTHPRYSLHLPCASSAFHLASTKHLWEPTKPLQTPSNLWAL